MLQAVSSTKDLRVSPQLLCDQELLTVQSQALLKLVSPVFFICHHIWSKPAQPQKLRDILVYRTTPLSQIDELLLHFSPSSL